MCADLADPCRVDLWKIPLIHSEPSVEFLAGLLSPDEMARANRFVFERDRGKYVRVRGLLRIILSRYLEIAPQLIEFRYEPRGKPHLADPLHPLRLRFNVSHSEEIGLIAVAFGREVGVDVEYIRREVDLREVAAQFFSRREILELFSLPQDLQRRGFFNCWTRKEAFVKAIGVGLTYPLDAFDVSLRPGEPAVLNELRPISAGKTQWMLRDVSPSDDYAAALAIEGDLAVSIVWREAIERSDAAMGAD